MRAAASHAAEQAGRLNPSCWPPAEIGQHQRAHRIALTRIGLGRARRRTDAALEPEAGHAASAPPNPAPNTLAALRQACSWCASATACAWISLGASLHSNTSGLTVGQARPIWGLEPMAWRICALATAPTANVLVSAMGVSSTPGSSTWIRPQLLPKPLGTVAAAGTLFAKRVAFVRPHDGHAGLPRTLRQREIPTVAPGIADRIKFARRQHADARRSSCSIAFVRVANALEVRKGRRALRPTGAAQYGSAAPCPYCGRSWDPARRAGRRPAD